MTDQELLQAIGHVVETKMEPMRQDILDIKEGVHKLEQRIDSLEQRIDSLEQRIDSLEQRVGALEEQMTGVRVYIDTELRRTLNLLLEGQQALWDRFAPREELEALEVRTSALEMAVKQHSQEIQELKLA